MAVMYDGHFSDLPLNLTGFVNPLGLIIVSFSV